MELRLVIRPTVEQRQELPHVGDMARSVFKATERLLQDPDFQKSLQFVASRKKMSAYRDMIDFLFCELVVCFRADCMRYYNDEGPQLRHHPRATPERIAEWDIFLAASLHVAHAAMEQNRRMSWSQFRETTERVLRATG